MAEGMKTGTSKNDCENDCKMARVKITATPTHGNTGKKSNSSIPVTFGKQSPTIVNERVITLANYK